MTDKNDVNIFTPEELAANPVSVDLPPAGAARNEELAQRADNLQQAAEELGENRGAVPEKFLKPDQEIQNDIGHGYMEIGKSNPLFKTCWVNFVNVNGQKIWEKKALGWKVATSKEFPEAKHMMREDNTIRVGDVLLMYIRIDQFVINERKEQDKKHRQQMGMDNRLYDIASKHPGAFVIHSGEDANQLATSGARQVAAQHIGNLAKKGKIPGMG